MTVPAQVGSAGMTEDENEIDDEEDVDVLDVDELLDVKELVEDMSSVDVEDSNVVLWLDSGRVVDDTEIVKLEAELEFPVSYLPMPVSAVPRRTIMAETHEEERDTMQKLMWRRPEDQRRSWVWYASCSLREPPQGPKSANIEMKSKTWK